MKSNKLITKTTKDSIVNCIKEMKYFANLDDSDAIFLTFIAVFLFKTSK